MSITSSKISFGTQFKAHIVANRAARHLRLKTLEKEQKKEKVVQGIEVLNVKVYVFILLLFASLPDCSQNQTAVSDTLRLLSDF